MSISRTISTILITAFVGLFTFIFTTPKKMLKNKDVSSKSRQPEVEEKENLFI